MTFQSDLPVIYIEIESLQIAELCSLTVLFLLSLYHIYLYAEISVDRSIYDHILRSLWHYCGFASCSWQSGAYSKNLFFSGCPKTVIDYG